MSDSTWIPDRRSSCFEMREGMDPHSRAWRRDWEDDSVSKSAVVRKANRPIRDKNEFVGLTSME